MGTLISSFALFSMKNLVLTTTPLAFSNVLIFGGIIVLKVLTEQKDKKFLKTTFSSYLAPEIIDEMYRNKTMPTLGRRSQAPSQPILPIFKAFSTFSEKLTADQLVELINEYLSAMTDILINEMGTLDKYEGDAIIAFFGAPHGSARPPPQGLSRGPSPCRRPFPGSAKSGKMKNRTPMNRTATPKAWMPINGNRGIAGR